MSPVRAAYYLAKLMRRKLEALRYNFTKLNFIFCYSTLIMNLN